MSPRPRKTSATTTTATRSAKRSLAKASTMSESHKAALREGRGQSRAVRVYLDALQTRTAPSHEDLEMKVKHLEGAIRSLSEKINGPKLNPVIKLQLLSDRDRKRAEKVRLQRALTRAKPTLDLQKLEDDFVKVAAAYGERRGITYAAWRSMGVPADVLARAGIQRTRRPAR